MKKLWLTLLAALALGTAHAQSTPAGGAAPYPSRVIKLIVPWPAGGDTDIIGRLVAQKLADAMGQPVVVDNRGGGSGSVGTEAVVRAPADGYTLLVVSMGTLTINQFLTKLDFDPVEDLAPVSMLVNIPTALVANPAAPYTDLKGMIALAKSNPGKLNVSSGSNAFRLFLEQFQTAAGISVEHVRYRGAGPAMNDILGGQVEMLIAGLPSITPHAKAGKLRVLAVTNTKRATAMPDVPTIGETLPGLEFNNWTALFVRAGTPQPIVDKLNAEVVRILNAPDVREKLLAMGAEPVPSTPQELGATVRRDAERFGKLVKATGMKAE